MFFNALPIYFPNLKSIYAIDLCPLKPIYIRRLHTNENFFKNSSVASKYTWESPQELIKYIPMNSKCNTAYHSPLLLLHEPLERFTSKTLEELNQICRIEYDLFHERVENLSKNSKARSEQISKRTHDRVEKLSASLTELENSMTIITNVELEKRRELLNKIEEAKQMKKMEMNALKEVEEKEIHALVSYGQYLNEVMKIRDRKCEEQIGEMHLKISTDTIDEGSVSEGKERKDKEEDEIEEDANGASCLSMQEKLRIIMGKYNWF